MEEFKTWVTEAFGPLVHSMNEDYAVIKDDDGVLTTVGRDYYFNVIKKGEKQ